MTNLEQAFLESATRYFRESQSKEIDLEQRRYNIAKDALAALLSNRKIGGVYASYSKVAVDYADALIIKIELDRIPGAKIMDIKGDVATRRCIVIPIDNERGTVIGSLQPWKIAPKKEEVKDENNW